ncbi:MAG: xanthine dehydrogenase family protein molybdopterin-binding subunit [Alphaproteobacteria bacterium]
MPPSSQYEGKDTSVPAEGLRRIGEAVQRTEDTRFVQGQGQYSDDVNRPGQCYCAFVRSPVAHGIVRAIDVEDTLSADGVIAVLTGRDYADDGCGPILHRAIEGDPANWQQPAFGAEDPAAIEIPQWPLPFDKVRHVGEPVAMVIAESDAAAIEGAERVILDIEELPPVVDVHQAAASNAPQVHDSAPYNLCVHALRGDAEAADTALAGADTVVRGTFNVPRVAGGQMEPRSGIGEYDAVSDRFTVTAGNQGVHRYRDMIASALGVEKEKVRVVCPDVGGGFGPRGHANPEYPALAWAAKRIGRPVKWTSARTEAFVSDGQGRDMVLEGELGIMRDGTICAYRLRILANIGAHTVCYAPVANASRLATTVYDIGAVSLDVRIYLTNTLPVLPFRAAGRPEITYALERLIDMAAADIGMDQRELRRRNLIARETMPRTSPLGLPYEDCAFEEAFDKAAELADWDNFASRRAEAEAHGKLRGIALVPFVESPVGAPFESATLKIAPDGKTVIQAGTQNHGQGHETTYAQVVSDLLGIPVETITLAQGDSDALAVGGGTHSDRSMRMVGSLLHELARDIVAQAKPVAAKLLQTDETELTFARGAFGIDGTGHTVGILEVAMAFPEFHGDGRTLGGQALQQGRIPAFPYGAAAAEIEIDPETGTLALCTLSVAHDCGVPVNPAIVHGQVHGGLVQGVGQAIGERVFYDTGSGQLLSGSFMDYMMARADQFTNFRVGFVAAPTVGNPLGIRAGGEGGTVPALAVIGNAVMDALAGHGIRHIELPLTSAAIWQALRDA